MRNEPRGIPPTATLYGSEVMIVAVSYPSSSTYPTNRIVSVCCDSSNRCSACKNSVNAAKGVSWYSSLLKKSLGSMGSPRLLADDYKFVEMLAAVQRRGDSR